MFVQFVLNNIWQVYNAAAQYVSLLLVYIYIYLYVLRTLIITFDIDSFLYLFLNQLNEQRKREITQDS